MHLKHKSSSTPGKAPQPADLERGEIAINLHDRLAYTKDQNDQIVAAIWQDVSSILEQYWWDGDRWLHVSQSSVKAGTYVASLTVEQAVAADSITVTLSATGHDDSKSFILWGDGGRDTGINGGKTHTYSSSGFYDIRIVLDGAATVINSIVVTGTSTKLRKIGPFSYGTKINAYEWGTSDTKSLDYEGTVVQGLTDGSRLFADRPLLHPSAVSGVDYDKLSDVTSFLEDRHDIISLPSESFAEATSLDFLAIRSGVSGIIKLSAPKAVSAKGLFQQTTFFSIEDNQLDLPLVEVLDDAFRAARFNRIGNHTFPAVKSTQNMFANATAKSVGGFTLPNLEKANGMFFQCNIQFIESAVQTTSKLTAISSMFLGVANPGYSSHRLLADYHPLVSDTSGATSATSMFRRQAMFQTQGNLINTNRCLNSWPSIWNLAGYDFSQCATVYLAFANVPLVGQFRPGDLGLDSTKGGAFFAGSKAGDNVWEWVEYIEIGFYGQHGGALYAGVAGQLSRLTVLTGNLYTNVTSINPSAAAFWADEKRCWKGTSMNQPSVDRLIQSIDVAVAATPALGAQFGNLDISGGNASAPSAAVVANEIVRLAAAGITITTN